MITATAMPAGGMLEAVLLSAVAVVVGVVVAAVVAWALPRVGESTGGALVNCAEDAAVEVVLD